MIFDDAVVPGTVEQEASDTALPTVLLDGAVTATNFWPGSISCSAGERVFCAQIKGELYAVAKRNSGEIQHSYTPTLNSTGGTQPSGWTCTGLYGVSPDGWCDFEASFVAASGFAVGSGVYIFGLPLACANSGIQPIGLAMITNTMYHYIVGSASADTNKQCRIYQPGSQTGEGNGGYYGHAWSQGNTIRINGRYRAA